MTMASAALQRMLTLLVKFRKCGWNGATCSSEETHRGQTTLLLDCQSRLCAQARQIYQTSHLFHFTSKTHAHTCPYMKMYHTQIQAHLYVLRHTSRNALTQCMHPHTHTHAGTHTCPPKPWFFLLPSKMFTVINSTRKETTHWFITDDIIHPGEFCKMAISVLWKAWAGVFLRSQAALKPSAVPLWAAGSN